MGAKEVIYDPSQNPEVKLQLWLTVGTAVPGRLLTCKLHMKQMKTDRLGDILRLQPTPVFQGGTANRWGQDTAGSQDGQSIRRHPLSLSYITSTLALVLWYDMFRFFSWINIYFMGNRIMLLIFSDNEITQTWCQETELNFNKHVPFPIVMRSWKLPECQHFQKWKWASRKMVFFYPCFNWDLKIK